MSEGNGRTNQVNTAELNHVTESVVAAVRGVWKVRRVDTDVLRPTTSPPSSPPPPSVSPQFLFFTELPHLVTDERGEVKGVSDYGRK